MRILIATGIYPPQAGGPAYYAAGLEEEFKKLGHTVTVRTYTLERFLPPGVRHVVYLLKTLPTHLRADITVVLDTFSVGFPVACLRRLFGGKVVLRTGGDFLWEQYVERTGEKIVFSKFYNGPRSFTRKERMIFTLTKWALRQADVVVFSSDYQRRVWNTPYGLEGRGVVITNAVPALSGGEEPRRKNFFCAVRRLKWKNVDMLERAFARAKAVRQDIELTVAYDISREELLQQLRQCYAIILVSLGDISPNFALEAVSLRKPLILTTENGISGMLKDAPIYVDPLDADAITEAILDLANEPTYDARVQTLEKLSVERSYRTVAEEILATSV